jgi:ActR/RegA family two-component response regulator
MKERGRVIVIEDDQDWQEILREYLEDAGFFVEVASSLETGLKKIKKERFHFATIDLQLEEDTLNPSEFEGWELLEKIINYRKGNKMPTMVITGFDKAYIKHSEIKKLRGTFFMPKKNFDRKKFIEKVVSSIEALDDRFFDDKKE